MASSSTANPSKAPKILSLIVGILGALILVTGIVVYGVTSSMLSAQQIKVSTMTADDPGSAVGQPVAGPFTALAQINVVQHHILAATGGRSFAQMPSVATSDGKTYNADVTIEKSTDGSAHAKGDPLSAADAKNYSSRLTAQTGSFTIASLMTSVMAFGVAALTMVLGLVIILVSVALVMTTRTVVRKQ